MVVHIFHGIYMKW